MSLAQEPHPAAPPQPFPREREALLRRLVLALALEPRPGSLLAHLRPPGRLRWNGRRAVR